MTAQLNQVAMVAALEAAAFATKFLDKAATREYAEQIGSTEDSQRISKDLFPAGAVRDGTGKITHYIGCGKKNSYRTAVSFVGKCRRVFYDLTLPTGHDNQYLVPMPQVDHLISWANGAKAELADLKVGLLADYDNLKELAKIARGPAYEESQYPPADELLERFNLNLIVRPIAQIPDVIQNIASSHSEHIRQQMIAEQEAQRAFARQELWERLLVPLRTLKEQLKDPTRKQIGPTLETLKLIVQNAPGLNFDHDPVFEEALGGLEESLRGLDADALRADAQARQAVEAFARRAVDTYSPLGRRALA